ncbi:MAG: fibronectin type III domain-containing protein [Myxococcaceae bacterium]
MPGPEPESQMNSVKSWMWVVLVLASACGRKPAPVAPEPGETAVDSLPAAPAEVMAKGQKRAAEIRWSWLGHGLGTGPTFTINSSPGDIRRVVTYSEANADPIQGLSAVITGLTEGVQYTFTITATNSVGEGPASAPSNPVIPSGDTPSLPTAPLEVKASAVNIGISVEWRAPAGDGGSILASYTVTSSPGGKQVTVQASQGTRQFAQFMGLEKGTEYSFRVRARNEVGEGPDSEPSAGVKNEVKIVVPNAPTAVAAKPSDGEATLSWEHVDNNDSALGRLYTYVVTVQPGSRRVELNALSPFREVPNLSNGVAYSFSMRVKNLAGESPESGPTAPVLVQGDLAGEPVSVTATAEQGAAKVAWTAQDPGPAIRSSTVTSNPDWIQVKVAGAETSVRVPGLRPGVAYTFTVHANTELGDTRESAPTAPVTPLP